MHHAATAITAPDTDHLPAYWQFHDAVARAQLAAWLPRRRHLIVDVSGPRGPGADQAATAGHTVLRVIDAGPGVPREPKGAAPTGLTSDEGARREGGALRGARRRVGKYEPIAPGCLSCPTAAPMTSSPRTGRCPPTWPPNR